MTRSFQQLNMTLGLRDAVDRFSKIDRTGNVKSVIQSVYGRLRWRELRGSDPVFTAGDLKEIKKAISAGRHSGKEGWPFLCEAFLKGKISDAMDGLEDLVVSRKNIEDCTFLSGA